MYDPNQSRRLPAMLPAPPDSNAPSLMDRAWDGLTSFLGGMEDPNLTPEQNATARRAAMLNAGLGAMASSNAGGSFGDAATAAAFAGQQGAAQSREEIIAQQEQLMAEARRRQIMQMMGVGGLPGMMDAFSFALGNGDFQSAQQIGAVLPAMLAAQPKPQGVQEWDMEEGRNPETGRIELFQLNPATGEKRWLGVEAPPKGSGVTINTGDAPENEFADRIAMKAFDNFDTAANTMNSISAIESALTDPETGELIDTGQITALSDRILAPVADFFNLNADDLNSRQLATAMANQGTLEKTSQLAGQISNYEIDFLKETLPQIANLPGANKLIFETYKRMFRAAAEDRELAERYAAREIDGGEYMRLQRELRNRQVLGDDLVRQIQDKVEEKTGERPVIRRDLGFDGTSG